MNTKKILRIGLTGGIACGKSEVEKCWRWLGAKVVDLDGMAHNAMENCAIADQIVEAFGTKIATQEHGFNHIDRKRLAKIVFKDPKKLKQLEAIIHPLVHLRWMETVAHAAGKEAAIVISHPLLYEHKHADKFDTVIVVGCTPETQIERMVANRGLTIKEAKLRLKAQLPIEFKLQAANQIIWNEGSVDELWKSASSVWIGLQNLAVFKSRTAR